MSQKYLSVPVFFLILMLWSCSSNENQFLGDIGDERVQFVITEIKNARSDDSLKVGKASVNFIISDDVPNEAEGFEIIRQNELQFDILASDPAGAMYGGLELAEQVKLYGWEGIETIQRNPLMKMRGVKFNIPLDARTPSYSDASDAGQKNIETVWDFSFWKSYIDNLARRRFNYISLWSLHPFPSLVKVPKYPEVALDDVWRSSVDWEENYHLHGTGLDAPEILDNPEVIKHIPIEEKIDFWKKVMAYGKKRNIDFYVITWNIFTNGTFGKYGITDDSKNEITRDYFKESVKQLFITYPDLKGIGLATGENMPGLSSEEKEEWAYDTYATGLLEAAQEMPERDFTFIHRQHQSGAKEILARFKSLLDQNNIEFLFCFKYAKAHVYSAVEQPYHHGYVEDIKGRETLWGLRNDDTYYFRWGAPDFVRTFIENIPKGDLTRGIYFGSDQWIWGRDFLTEQAQKGERQLEIEKHWYQWMLWGRLSYDPKVSNERFIDIIQNRYPSLDAKNLFSAWQKASMVYPITTGFHWGALDFQWYIEGCQSRPGPANNEIGFHDINRFISLPPHPLSGYQSIPDFVEKGREPDLLTPFEVSALLHQKADSALLILPEMIDGSPELAVTLQDIKTISNLGKYYAHKIAGSTYTAMYRAKGELEFQKNAIEELERASEYWKAYVELASKNNINPLWTNRVGFVDWKRTTEWVEEDIILSKQE